MSRHVPEARLCVRSPLVAVLTVLLAACASSPSSGPPGGVDNPYRDGADHPWFADGAATLRVQAVSPGANVLSRLTWTSASSGWGPIELDRSNGEKNAGDGRPLTLNGVVYATGLGVHASSTVTYDLGGACSTFTASVGLDDEIDGQTQYGSVVFQVFADGAKLYDSGVRRGASPTARVNANVTGARELKLVVTDAGDGNAYDHADWADAKLECAPAAAPIGATTRVTVDVPPALRAAPFDTARFLNVPPDFTAAVYARVPKARFLLPLPNGDLLVSQPSTGKVLLVRPGADGAAVVSDFATNLKKPHDLVLHAIGGTTYLYVSESNRVTRSVHAAGDATRRAAETIVRDLPDGNSSGALQGAYGHELKNIALRGDRLYVSIASASNADPRDLQQNPKQGAIYEYAAGSSGQAATSGRLFAQGLRNAEGLAFVPGGTDLWAVVNNRDQIGYPFHGDWQNDGTGDDYGQVIASYVDNHPPEEFTRVRDGGNYGWPLCNPNPDAGLANMPFDRDVQNNADGGKLDCATADRISRGIQAHSAPLGLTFLQDTAFPAAYRAGAVTALHGSWNRTVPTGYKVAYFPWNATANAPGEQVDLVTGWLVNGSAWGRPVDVAVDRAGALLISDDAAGAIYRVAPKATQAVTSLTLVNADTDRPVPGFDPLVDGAVLDFSTLPTRRLSVRANTSPASVGSVRFALDGNASFKTENAVPYAIAGDAQGGADFLPWTPSVGEHTLTVTPFSGPNATGTPGAANTVRFSVVE